MIFVFENGIRENRRERRFDMRVMAIVNARQIFCGIAMANFNDSDAVGDIPGRDALLDIFASPSLSVDKAGSVGEKIRRELAELFDIFFGDKRHLIAFLCLSEMDIA